MAGMYKQPIWQQTKLNQEFNSEHRHIYYDVVEG